MNMSVPELQKLSKLVANGDANLNMTDRIGLLSDSYSMAEAGYGNTLSVLSLIKSFNKESDYIILSKMIGQVNSIMSVWYQEPDAVLEKLKEMKRSLASPKLDALGWVYKAGEDHLVSMKRTLVISSAGRAGDESVIAEAKKRFKMLVGGSKDAIPSDLLSTCISLALANSDAPTDDFNALLVLYKATTSQEHKMAMISSMGAINSLDIITNRILTEEIIWNKEVIREQDLFYVLSGINGNKMGKDVKPILWAWFKSNFDGIAEKFKNSMGLYGTFLSYA
jgi:aminopeptidase N